MWISWFYDSSSSNQSKQSGTKVSNSNFGILSRTESNLYFISPRNTWYCGTTRTWRTEPKNCKFIWRNIWSQKKLKTRNNTMINIFIGTSYCLKSTRVFFFYMSKCNWKNRNCHVRWKVGCWNIKAYVLFVYSAKWTLGSEIMHQLLH